MKRVLMKGNEAIGEAAIRSGCFYFFGYPITPQSELPEYLAKNIPKAGGVYLQAESEIAAINMVFGAASAGVRVMTSSSGPGISLKQEGISYLAGAQLPCVIVNIMRGGPGLGNIAPCQSDYYQATRGGGHGDYRTIVLAPATVQESVDLVFKAFNLADKYRMPVIILGDGILGQMMEPVDFTKCERPVFQDKAWGVGSGKNGAKKLITSLYLNPEILEKQNLDREKQYQNIKNSETLAECYRTEDAEIVIAAFGIAARIAKAAVDMAREEGIKAGLFRPLTLWPFPEHELNTATARAKEILTVEMNTGQMIDDVKLAINCRLPVGLYSRTGGMLPAERAILEEINKINQKEGDN